MQKYTIVLAVLLIAGASAQLNPYNVLDLIDPAIEALIKAFAAQLEVLKGILPAGSQALFCYEKAANDAIILLQFAKGGLKSSLDDCPILNQVACYADLIVKAQKLIAKALNVPAYIEDVLQDCKISSQK